MPEFRQNMATKEWIIFATERARRPEDFVRSRPPAEELPAYSSTCPFCPGQEAMTPDPVLVLPQQSDASAWDVRVVPNKFPALSPPEGGTCDVCSMRVGPYLRREGVGNHEVVIESPLHNIDLPFFNPEHMEHVLSAYSQRYNIISAESYVGMVVIFRNHGANAGTSLIHPHSQIVASSVVPFPVRNRLYEGQRYYDMFGRCVYCDIIAYEMQQQSRIIMDNGHFIALSPYASSVPYEIWLLPKRHHATFGTITAGEIHDLSVSLQNMLSRLWRLLDDPDYNYVIDTAPEHMYDVPFYHWHLEIYPKLTTPAGFEIGSGIGINVVMPEDASAQLRDTDGAPLTMEEAKRRHHRE